MKKAIAFLLALVMLLLLAACGGSAGSKKEKALVGTWKIEESNLEFYNDWYEENRSLIDGFDIFDYAVVKEFTFYKDGTFKALCYLNDEFTATGTYRVVHDGEALELTCTENYSYYPPRNETVQEVFSFSIKGKVLVLPGSDEEWVFKYEKK